MFALLVKTSPAMVTVMMNLISMVSKIREMESPGRTISEIIFMGGICDQIHQDDNVPRFSTPEENEELLLQMILKIVNLMTLDQTVNR